MILNGSQRAGAAQLAHHLMNTRDNDRVAVHDLRGFMADHLLGAFKKPMRSPSERAALSIYFL